MQFQRSPFPAEVEYFLDSAVEHDELGAFAHAVLTLLGSRKLVPELIEKRKIGHLLHCRQSRCHELDAYAHEIIAELAEHERRSFVAVGLRWEPRRLLNIAEYLASFNFEDETRGGANLPFRRHWRCDDNYDPTPRARRRLYAPGAIRRYARLEDCSMPWARLLAGRLRQLPAAVPADLDLVCDLLLEQRETYRVEYHRARQKFEAEQRRRFFSNGSIERDRRAVRRAASFCAGLLGPAKVGAFARGEAITFAGRDVSIEVARARSIATVGHGALEVKLCAQDGTRLANVCVFFDKTPALDQLAAIAMHVEAGDESAIIQTGNLFNVTAAGSEHPVVRARLAQMPKAEVEVLAPGRRRRTASEYDKQKAALRRYTADTIDIYAEAVRARVWGRDVKRLDPFLDQMQAAIGEIKGRAA
ncbi:hypothetical protein AB7M45_007901 [Bradyrhizobium elkanii]|uniref:hypothetical protein n=1 Tax=Bradyrhizobium elkanii TaxID=29448 RepID=UPI0009228F4B|nr:hypothetical protein [Bradyrhizobium elkanii]MCW2195130.1 hypothetical protein [Bradyrhizobium elkanii]NWL67181.1 hypothetical protein [Bradyrhizobium elkanii]OIM93229.1 hypothetical protein BLN97_17650 [Bradyrhizobium elkanii]